MISTASISKIISYIVFFALLVRPNVNLYALSSETWKIFFFINPGTFLKLYFFSKAFQSSLYFPILKFTLMVHCRWCYWVRAVPWPMLLANKKLRAVVYYGCAAHTFSVGTKCWHCIYCLVWSLSTFMAQTEVWYAGMYQETFQLWSC